MKEKNKPSVSLPKKMERPEVLEAQLVTERVARLKSQIDNLVHDHRTATAAKEAFFAILRDKYVLSPEDTIQDDGTIVRASKAPKIP